MPGGGTVCQETIEIDSHVFENEVSIKFHHLQILHPETDSTVNGGMFV